MRALSTALLLAVMAVPARTAEWGPPILVTRAETHINNPTLAVAGDRLFLATSDLGADDEGRIVVRRSVDGGARWSRGRMLSDRRVRSFWPVLAVAGQRVHLAWEERAATLQLDLYYRLSDDGGDSWEPPVLFGGGRDWFAFPVLLASGREVHLAWHETRASSLVDPVDHDLFYRRSRNGGRTWKRARSLGQSSGAAPWVFGLAQTGRELHLVWPDIALDRSRLLHRRSPERGRAWQPSRQLARSRRLLLSQSARVATDDERVHVVWSDYDPRTQQSSVFTLSSDDRGATWSQKRRLSRRSISIPSPQILVDGSQVHLAWLASAAGGWAIRYTGSGDRGVHWTEPERLARIDTPGGAEFSLAAAEGRAYVAWTEVGFEVAADDVVTTSEVYLRIRQ